ncbi:MAG: hypothetical protein ACFFEY_00965 [Candidatus Thorarchaeota archaeon]
MSNESRLPSENEIEKDIEKEEKIILRSYSKVIFFYPLFFTSLILFLIQYIVGTEEPWFGAIWITVFFANLFVIAFDTSSTKFFILILAAIILILLFAFIFHPNTIISQVLSFEVAIVMSYHFYLASTVTLGIIFLIAWIATRLDYWKLERNELIHKKGIFISADRYPTKSLRIKKEIPDIFEYLLLKSGSLHLFTATEEITYLHTVLNINKKEEMLDYLLSEIEIEVEKE